jgi:hypothetical protein
MNETERSLDAPSQPALTELQAEVEALKKLVSVVVVLLILVSFSVDVYMMRQVTTVNRELAGAQNVIDDFNKRVAPAAGEFWTKLNEYGRSHPDFAPVLAKYTNFVTTATVPATAPKKN